MSDPVSRLLAEKDKDVLHVRPEVSVADAAKEMNRHRVGALLVLNEHGKPVGIFTERDILKRVVAQGLDPELTPVSQVMTREVMVIHPTVTVEQAMAIITEQHMRHLPVVEGGKVIGMLSAGDLTKWVSRGHQIEIRQLVEYITGKYPG